MSNSGQPASARPPVTNTSRQSSREISIRLISVFSVGPSTEHYRREDPLAILRARFNRLKQSHTSSTHEGKSVKIRRISLGVTPVSIGDPPSFCMCRMGSLHRLTRRVRKVAKKRNKTRTGTGGPGGLARSTRSPNYRPSDTRFEIIGP